MGTYACSLTNSRSLQVVQNNALRAVANTDARYPTDRLNTSLEVEWLDVSRQKAVCIETYKILNGLSPANLQQKVEVKIPDRMTRSSSQLQIARPHTRTVLGDMNFIIRSHKYWAKIPNEITVSESLSELKNSLKIYQGLEHTR